MKAPALAALVLLAGCTGPASPGEAPSFMHIHAVAPDPTEAGVLWVATHQGIIKGTRGTDWTWSHAGSDRSDYMGFTLHPTETDTAYSSGHPVRGGNQGIRKSTDDAATWTPIALQGAADCHALAIRRAPPHAVYCGASSGKFYLASDGATFQEVPATGLPRPVNAMAGTSAGRILAATSTGLYGTTDGASWSRVGNATGPILAIAVDPGTDAQWFASFATGGVQTSMDGGASWHSIHKGIGTAVPTSLAVDPHDGSLYAAAGTTIYQAGHAGATWSVLRSGA